MILPDTIPPVPGLILAAGLVLVLILQNRKANRP